MVIEPAVGFSKPASRFKTVVFPQPLGPKMHRNSPHRMVRLKSRTTSSWLAPLCLKPTPERTTRSDSPTFFCMNRGSRFYAIRSDALQDVRRQQIVDEFFSRL